MKDAIKEIKSELMTKENRVKQMEERFTDTKERNLEMAQKE